MLAAPRVHATCSPSPKLSININPNGWRSGFRRFSQTKSGGFWVGSWWVPGGLRIRSGAFPKLNRVGSWVGSGWVPGGLRRLPQAKSGVGGLWVRCALCDLGKGVVCGLGSGQILCVLLPPDTVVAHNYSHRFGAASCSGLFRAATAVSMAPKRAMQAGGCVEVGNSVSFCL